MKEIEYEQNFKAGLYVRLSREDEDKQNTNDFSESIKNQKEFLAEYAVKNGYSIVDIYADDGISGTTFDREDFNRMLADIEFGKINMVITKDLSRLGRDYIKTGEYLEKYFPSKNVRYIAVNDGYDSFKEENSNNEMAPFKAVFNDMYAKDISKKVRTALKTKQIKGEYLGTVAPYGYKKDSKTKGKLVIDEVSSKYVKKTFELYLSGKSILEISNILTKLKIPTPSEYLKISNTQKYIKGAWNDKTVRFILKNEVYIGNTIQNKRRKINYKINKQIEIPKEQWLKVENTHQPIISRQDFEMVQEILNVHSYKSVGAGLVSARNKRSHLLSGLLFCGNCKAPMTFIPMYNKQQFYICCSTAKRYKKELGLCKMKLYKEKEIEQIIIEQLKQITQQHIDSKKIINSVGAGFHLCPDYKKAINNFKIKIQEIQKVSLNLYKDKVKNLITEKQFLELLKEINEEKEEYIFKMNEVKQKIENEKAQEKNNSILEQVIRQVLSLENIDNSTLSLLIEKIVLNLDGTIEINFKFRQRTE